MLSVGRGAWHWMPADAGYCDHETGIWEDPPVPAFVYRGEETDDPSEDDIVAWMNVHWPWEQQERVACLLAAAPDLLKSLEEMVELETDLDASHERITEVLNRAVKAIERAKGAGGVS